MCHGKLEQIEVWDQELMPIKKLRVEKTPKDSKLIPEGSEFCADGASSDKVLRQKDMCFQDASQ